MNFAARDVRDRGVDEEGSYVATRVVKGKMIYEDATRVRTHS